MPLSMLSVAVDSPATDNDHASSTTAATPIVTSSKSAQATTTLVDGSTFGRTFHVTELSSSFQRLSVLSLIITPTALCTTTHHSDEPTPGSESTKSILGSLEHITFIDIGQFLGKQDADLFPAIQFNTTSGVHSFLCNDASQKSELARYWNSLMRFLRTSRSEGPFAAFDSTVHISDTSHPSNSPKKGESYVTLEKMVQRLQSFNTLSGRFKTKIIAMEAAIQAKTTCLQTMTRQFRELEVKNMLDESQNRNMEIMERYYKAEKMYQHSSEKLARLQYHLDDRVAVLDEKHEL
ncbi:hypothetical protein BSLG_007906 [Batrachochytrium salamandrivorans]|nr:hypothetical protein BSLG_007906 [Batrachochytrium salamandrivorans]